MTPWIHKVQYYETDAMQVVHHSNYIRWFEEARIHLMEEYGIGYDKFEAAGILCPVVTVEAKLSQSVRFGETVRIDAAVEKNDGVRLTVNYQVVRLEDNTVCCTGKTSHCFLSKEDSRLISLKKNHPDFYEKTRQLPTEF